MAPRGSKLLKPPKTDELDIDDDEIVYTSTRQWEAYKQYLLKRSKLYV